MAHIGKKFPVLWRRDLSVATDEIARYYPQKYKVLFDNGLTSDLFALNDITGQLLENTEPKNSIVRKWVGRPTTPPPLSVIPEIEVTDLDWGNETKVSYRLKLENTFRVLDFECILGFSSRRYDVINLFTVVNIVILDSRIDFTPGAFAFEVAAARWADL